MSSKTEQTEMGPRSPLASAVRLRRVRWIRRSVQVFFLLLFVGLVFAARRPEKGAPSPLLELFFDLDPFVALTTFFATRALPALLLLSLVTVAVTLVFGRVFCGWFCPLGTLNSMVSALRRGPAHELIRTEQASRWQHAKYYLLAGLLVMSLFGAQVAGVFDPFSILYRGLTTAVLPAAQYGVEESANAVYRADPHLGPLHATTATEPAYRFVKDKLFVVDRKAFYGGWLIAVVLAAILLLNLYRKRFWCRYVCPLGALLGLIAWRPLLRLKTGADGCNRCGICKVDCQGAASPDRPGEWQASECFMCLNCGAKCNWSAIDFEFGSPLTPASEATLDVDKRALLTAGGVGVASLLALRLTPEAQGKVYNPGLIRPPGARSEREFIDRCVRCGLCLEACPTNGLQAAVWEAGLEGLWTPRLSMRVGYCEHECNLCGQVCPTEAIQPLPLPEKQQVKMGLATFDTARCLPYAYERECMICEEHCPLPKKAIHFVPTEVVTRSGAKKVLKQPRVDADLCIGCGICENKCVFRDLPAIRVTSANETRHSANQPILPGISGMDWTAPAAETPATDPYGGGGDPYGG